MKCANHPARDSFVHCVSCKKPICQDCATDQGDGTFQCLSCSFRLTMRQMSERKQERAASKRTRELKDLERRKKKRLYLLILVLVCLVGALGAVEFLLRPPRAPKETEQFVPSRDSPAFVLFINQALCVYSANHGGLVPSGLEELLGRYLPEKVSTQDLQNLVYERKSPSSYELRAKKTSSHKMPDILFTEEGTWMGGKFEKY